VKSLHASIGELTQENDFLEDTWFCVSGYRGGLAHTPHIVMAAVHHHDHQAVASYYPRKLSWITKVRTIS